MSQMSDQEIRSAVLERYRRTATQGGGCCAGPSTGCCGPQAQPPSPQDISTALGYSPEDLAAVPQGANLGLGCGNPQAIAQLKPGETVLDLGSGGGFDCFLAARQVGPAGRVIGVDMTPERVGLARGNAAKTGAANVEFRLGEIEHLPVADHSVDVILSNCVINLAADKLPVYREAYRVLKAGGRLAISDVVATRPLPAELARDLALWSSCAAGALQVAELHDIMARVGFVEIAIEVDENSRQFIDQWATGQGLGQYLASARIQARRPLENEVAQ
ncbi:MAG: arsenite methyltransferase [Desulfarculus sp.]|nr:arsenite methyltransferase [Desulfarculus sp.]